MSWEVFIYFAAAAILFWLLAASVSVFTEKTRLAAVLSALGSVIFLSFIIGFWISLGRPPLRTMGETRLWYSFFLSLVGLGIYVKWKYRWILPFGTLMSCVFVAINIFQPEIHSEALVPALQSPWFIPHVTVYMFAYSLMGAATLFAIYLWIRGEKQSLSPDETGACDTLVKIGWGLLSAGMVMGALWAKEAWGDYWTFDPKETWAAATWMSYLLYIHLSPHLKDKRPAYALLIFSFLLLQMCWWGVNLLESSSSLHKY